MKIAYPFFIGLFFGLELWLFAGLKRQEFLQFLLLGFIFGGLFSAF